jgi:hypothetical protein
MKAIEQKKRRASLLKHSALLVLCQENGHVKQREIAEFMQLLFSG